MKLLVAFAVLGLSIASAKTFHIDLSTPAKAGNADLAPGHYNVVLNASQVRFTDVDTGKSTETNAKVQNVAKKFAYTAVESKTVDGHSQIQEIDLGGTKTKATFN
ncbi:MAG: hypothetical protein ACRD9L_14965 [Bryobacteraceae bacterium]